jgi:hypothetical protein
MIRRRPASLLQHSVFLKGRTMNKHLLLASLALTAVLAVAQPAEAAQIKAMVHAWGGETTECFEPSSDFAEPAFVTTQTLPTEATSSGDLSEPALGTEDLDALAGEGIGDLNVITGQTLTAITAGNTINAGTVGSGAITLDQNAFSGFDGIGNFVINSGHNNTLQSSLSVSIVLAP